MSSRIFGRSAAVAGLVAILLAPAFTAHADNSEIVIIDQHSRSTPFGDYDSRRRTQVYGPSSGFRYEEYTTPVVPVYPRYGYGRGHDDRHGHRDDRDRRGSYAYGPSYRDRGHGRVIDNYGYGAYGRFGAPAAPHVNERYDRYGHSRPGRDRDDYQRFDRNRGRAVQPAQRAVPSAERAIR